MKAMEATSVNLAANLEEEEEKVSFDWFGLSVLIIQVVFIVFFFVFCRFTAPTEDSNSVIRYWKILGDVTIMIFVGFGFLMTFLKRHRFSAIGYTFFIAVVAVQWQILVGGFYHWVLDRSASQIDITFESFVLGMFGAGALLISFGVWIGKVGIEQLLFMGLLEKPLFVPGHW